MNISSPFAETLISDFKEWLEKLLILQKNLNKYQKALIQWINLEPLFIAGKYIKLNDLHFLFFSNKTITKSNWRTHIHLFLFYDNL